MKLASMTKEQKSRWIAEKLEPLAALPKTIFPGQQSPLCFWRSVYYHDAYSETGNWNFRDMTEPATTEALLDHIAARQNVMIEAMDGLWTIWLIPTGDYPSRRTVAHKIRAIAVLDAAMLAHGFREEEA